MKHKLTPKQRKFADDYIEHGNAYQSAIKAGYSKKYAKAQSSKMLENVGIKSYIDKRMNQIASDKIMDVTEAVELLSSIARGEVTETKVVGTQYGADTVDVPPDLKTRISAVKEILKRHPNDDTMLKVQLRKLNAEADMAEYNAETIKLEKESVNNNSVQIIDDIKGDNKDGEENKAK